MKTGTSVKVKKGVISPDFGNLLIEGWTGRVLKNEGDFLNIELDSITLDKLPEAYIMDGVVNHFDYTCLHLQRNEVEITDARDTEAEVIAMKNKLEAQYPDDEYSCEAEDKRIHEILKTKEIDVNYDNLDTYYTYLKAKLTAPLVLIGMQDFSWEEPYLLGGWDPKEYEELKKTRPSYTDKFELLNIEEDYSEEYGIFVNVKRISDKKKFTIPLWDLEVVDKTDPNFLLVSDYSSWMTNSR